MIIFNNREFDFVRNTTIAEFIELMHIQNVIDKNKALLVTLNNKLLSPSEIHTIIINDGDSIKTRLMPVGG